MKFINEEGLAPIILIVIAGIVIIGGVIFFNFHKNSPPTVITDYVPSQNSSPSATGSAAAKPLTKTPSPSSKPTVKPQASSVTNSNSSNSNSSTSSNNSTSNTNSSASPTSTPTSTPNPSSSTDPISLDKTSVTITLSRQYANGGRISLPGLKVTSHGATGFNFANDQAQSGVGLDYSSQGILNGTTVGVDAFITTEKPNGVYTGTNTLHYTYNNQQFVGETVTYTITLTD